MLEFSVGTSDVRTYESGNDMNTRDGIAQRWMHSHEEDTAEEIVYRPANFAFPPSRGRAGFELKGDGTYLDLGTGPADGPQQAEGEWQLADDVLTLACDALPGGRRTLRVITCGDDRLVVAR